MDKIKKFVKIFMPNKILVLKNRKIIKILRINVEVTCDIKNLTLYIGGISSENEVFM